MAPRPKGTSTSNFGVSRRESHDASDFYARFAAPDLSRDGDVAESEVVDELFCGDARSMDRVADRSVALVVTSPPYFAGKEYEQALGEGHVPATYLDYLAMLRDVFAECARKLEPGGRIAVNVANLGRRPYRSLSSDVIHILQDDLKLLLRGEVIWHKAKGSAGSCAWGSFQRPANPVLRDLTERVVIASKGRFDRALAAPERESRSLSADVSLSRDEFMEATTDVWEIPAESATRVGHPAPFPIELPSRLIHLYTYYDDLVLDPFVGSGTTAVAAVRHDRRFIGYDTDEQYLERARERVGAERDRLEHERASGTPATRFVVPPIPSPADPAEDLQARATREGRAAKDVAEQLLVRCGFTDIEKDVKLGSGVEVSFKAFDRLGHPWYFDVSGGFTSTRPGLKRTDTLWRAVGKAAVVNEIEAGTPLVLLTTDAPTRQSAGGQALGMVTGPEKPVTAVLEMLNPTHQARLARYATGGS